MAVWVLTKHTFYFSSKLCVRKDHGGLYKPQRRKKEESERLTGEGDRIKFIDRRFERWQVADLGKEEEGKTFHKLNALEMNDDLWDIIN